MVEPLYCGLDLHKRFSYIVVKDGHGRQLAKGRVDNSEDDLQSFFAPFKDRDLSVAIEATSNYYWMFETLDKMNMSVKLSHPLKTKMIADAKVKSDKIDADVLSDLLRTNFLPVSYIPDQKIRALREVLRHRMRLVCIRTQLKNQLRAVLMKNNCLDSYTDITGIKARHFIEQLSLAPAFKLQCSDILAHIDFITKRLESINAVIKTYAKDFPETERLISIPGIGIFSALVIVAEIGDINRFPNPKKLVRYAGLCPGLHQSGDTCYHKPLTHDGDRYLRWILTEAAHHAVRHTGPLKDFYTCLAKTKGSQKAIVAVARKMLTGIYFVLKNSDAFNPVRRKQHYNRIANLDKPATGPWSSKTVGTIG